MESLMEHYPLSSHLTIPRIILGTWQLAPGHHQEQRDLVDDVITSYLQHGVTMLTTTNIYNGVEKELGHYLAKHEQDFSNHALPRPQIATALASLPAELVQIELKDMLYLVDSALRRLQVDCIDLYQYFCWDMDIATYIRIGEYLKEAKQAGKIKEIGVLNVDTTCLKALLEHGIPIVSNQVQYSVLDRRAEKALLSYCQQHHVGVLAYGTMAGGFLSEHYLNQESLVKTKNLSLKKYTQIIEQAGGWQVFQQALHRLGDIAAQHAVSIAQLVCSYTLHQPGVAAILLGASDTKYLLSNIAIATIQLSTEDLATIRSAIEMLKILEGDIYEKELELERLQGRLKDAGVYPRRLF